MHDLKTQKKLNDEAAAREVRQLRKQVKELKGLVRVLSRRPVKDDYPLNVPITLGEHRRRRGNFPRS